MKRILTITAVLFSAVVFGQQEFQTSQYQQNMFLLNPGAAGVKDYVDLNIGFRQQWTGINGAPRTYFVSANSMLGGASMGGNKLFSLRMSDPTITTEDGYDLDANNTVVDRKVRHALGGYIMGDEFGPFTSSVGALTYAVHVPLGEKTTLSLGAKAKVHNLSFDANSIRISNATGTATQENNQQFQNFTNGVNDPNNTFVDGGLGLFLYHDNFFAGFSMENLFSNDFTFGDATADGTIQTQSYITGGYRFAINDKVGLTPSALFRITEGAPVSADYSVRLDVNRFFGGISVRPEDAVVLMAGLGIAKNLNLGYSYDITTSELNQRGNGTHEFVLNIMLDKN